MWYVARLTSKMAATSSMLLCAAGIYGPVQWLIKDSTRPQLSPRFAVVADFESVVPNSLSMLDCFRLDSTARNKVGRTSGSGLVPIEAPTLHSGDQICGTL